MLLLFSLCYRCRPCTRDRDSCTGPLSLLLHARPGQGRSSTSFSSAGLLLTTLSSVFCFPNPSPPVPSLWLSSLPSSSSPTALSSFPSWLHPLHCLNSFFLIVFLTFLCWFKSLSVAFSSVVTPNESYINAHQENNNKQRFVSASPDLAFISTLRREFHLPSI